MACVKYLWLAVTVDKYEFPIHIEDTAKALGERLGISGDTVIQAVTRKRDGKKSGRKILKIEVSEEEYNAF